MPLGLLVVAAGLAGLAAAPVTGLALMASAVTGDGFLLGVAGTDTELQRALPDELRGGGHGLVVGGFLGCADRWRPPSTASLPT